MSLEDKGICYKCSEALMECKCPLDESLAASTDSANWRILVECKWAEACVRFRRAKLDYETDEASRWDEYLKTLEVLRNLEDQKDAPWYPSNKP